MHDRVSLYYIYNQKFIEIFVMWYDMIIIVMDDKFYKT